MPNKLDTLLDPKVAQEFLNDGYSVRQLAEEFWVSDAVAYSYVNEHGLKPPASRSFENVVDLDLVVKMLNEGAHFSDVAEHYGFSTAAVKRYCGEQGIFQVFRIFKNGNRIRLRDDARSEAVTMNDDLLGRMIVMLEQAMSWDDISKELGYSRAYCNNFATQNGVRSMYTRVNGKLYQIRSNPREPKKFEKRICIDEPIRVTA